MSCARANVKAIPDSTLAVVALPNMASSGRIEMKCKAEDGANALVAELIVVEKEDKPSNRSCIGFYSQRWTQGLKTTVYLSLQAVSNLQLKLCGPVITQLCGGGLYRFRDWGDLWQREQTQLFTLASQCGKDMFEVACQLQGGYRFPPRELCLSGLSDQSLRCARVD